MKLKRSTSLTRLSRCFNSGLSEPTEIDGCIHISIVDAAAFGARPFSHAEWLTLSDVSAVRAAFRGRESTVHFNQSLPVPLRLVLKLANELTPRGIADGLRQRAILLHVLHRQGFDGDHIELFNEARRELVQEVGSAVGYFRMCLRHPLLLALPVVRAPLLSRKVLLLFAQAAVGIFEKARIAHLLACRKVI